MGVHTAGGGDELVGTRTGVADGLVGILTGGTGKLDSTGGVVSRSLGATNSSLTVASALDSVTTGTGGIGKRASPTGSVSCTHQLVSMPHPYLTIHLHLVVC